jgi:hypothetical protein
LIKAEGEFAASPKSADAAREIAWNPGTPAVEALGNEKIQGFGIDWRYRYRYVWRDRTGIVALFRRIGNAIVRKSILVDAGRLICGNQRFSIDFRYGASLKYHPTNRIVAV